MFCPKCGSILKPKLIDGKKILSCSCGHKDKDTSSAMLSIKSKQDEQKVEVVSQEQDDDVLPETEAECPKCGNKIAFYWLIQTRAADEPETKFLKCKNCKHIWRDYS